MTDTLLGMSTAEVEAYARSLTTEDFIEREQALGVGFGPWHQQWQLARAPEKVHRYLERARTSEIRATRQYFQGMDASDINPSSFGAIANTVTESCLWNATVTTAQQTTWAPIPAGDMRAGKGYRVSFGGIISTTGTPTVIWTPRVGDNTTAANAANISLGASPTITTVTGLSNHAFYGIFEWTVRSLGMSASLATGTGNGFVAWGNSAAAATVGCMGGTVATTINQTVLVGTLVNLTWGTQSASNTCTCQYVIPTSLN